MSQTERLLIPVVTDLLVGGPAVFPSLGISETVYVVFGFKPGITISVGRSVIGISCGKNTNEKQQQYKRI